MGFGAVSSVLHGVGLGPGDPELLTLKAHRLISTAAVVAFPAPAGGESFARSIAAAFIAAEAEEIRIEVPMTAERAPAQAAYDAGAAAIASHLEKGRDVVCLCEGDPLFYGSFMYLQARLAERFRVEITPGVSSMAAGAAALGWPLTARDESLVAIPATLPESEIEARLMLTGAAVILKVGRRLGRLKAMIARLGLMERAGYVAHATLARETVTPLAEAPEAAPYFSLIIIRGDDPFAQQGPRA